jgi:hypothetical protein
MLNPCTESTKPGTRSVLDVRRDFGGGGVRCLRLGTKAATSGQRCVGDGLEGVSHRSLNRWARTLRGSGAGLVLALVGCSSGEIGALPSSASEVARIYAGECDEGVASSCFALALLYSLGEDAGHGIAADAERAETLRAKACDGGLAQACADDALLPPASIIE